MTPQVERIEDYQRTDKAVGDGAWGRERERGAYGLEKEKQTFRKKTKEKRIHIEFFGLILRPC